MLPGLQVDSVGVVPAIGLDFAAVLKPGDPVADPKRLEVNLGGLVRGDRRHLGKRLSRWGQVE